MASSFGTRRLGLVNDGNFNLDPALSRLAARHTRGWAFFGLVTIGETLQIVLARLRALTLRLKIKGRLPTHPQKDCPWIIRQQKMLQNYLDYTDDVCMNIFTQGQRGSDESGS